MTMLLTTPGVPTPRHVAQAKARAAQSAALAHFNGSPLWSIRDDALTALTERLAAADPMAFWWDDDDDDYEDDEPSYVITENGVALIPIQGILLDCEPSWWMSWLGGSSTPAIGRMARAAFEDARVREISLVADSPGGQASGLAAVADILFAIREEGTKRLTALCKEACSAAYHLVSQAERIIVAPDGVSGCIGTLIVARDVSKMYAEIGISVERITSTGGEKYKGAGTYGAPITEEQKADWKRVADESQELFNADVARGRGISDEEAQALADGRYYIGANAIPLNLVDTVMGLEEALMIVENGEEFPDNDAPPATLPAPAPSPEDNDDTNQSRRNAKTAIPRTGKEKTTMSGPLSFLRGGKKDTPLPPASEKNPETDQEKTAQATEAELTALRAENDNLRAENKRLSAFRSDVVKQFRDAAEQTAVTKFGQNTPELERAQRRIAAIAESDPLQLVDLAEEWEAAMPTSYRPERQTKSVELQDREGKAETDKEYYDSIRAETRKEFERQEAAAAAGTGGRRGR